MLNFNTIRETLVAAQESEAKRVAEKAKMAEKAVETLLDYTCQLIEDNMDLDTENQTVFASIDREKLTPEYWEKFEHYGLTFKTKLPQALNERLDGVEVSFNTLSYDKVEDYVFFKFGIELV